jgi:DNA-binding HxlR family transcriptional regulator
VAAYERTCLIRGNGGRAIRRILDRIGDTWSLLVVATLDGERMRFTELGRGLVEPAVTLAEWAVEHDPDVGRNQARYDAREA